MTEEEHVSNDQELEDASQEARDEYWSHFEVISMGLEEDLRYLPTPAEKIVRIKSTLDYYSYCFPNPVIFGDGGNYAQHLQQLIETQEEVLRIQNSFANAVPAYSADQTQAFKRVAEVFEKQAFWAGSLSDFVFVFDTLALKGFLKATELEEALSESFAHKGQGKKKIEKLTPEKIKNRRRNMNVSTPAHTASEKIRKVVSEVIEKMPSKKKD